MSWHGKRYLPRAFSNGKFCSDKEERTTRLKKDTKETQTQTEGEAKKALAGSLCDFLALLDVSCIGFDDFHLRDVIHEAGRSFLDPYVGTRGARQAFLCNM